MQPPHHEPQGQAVTPSKGKKVQDEGVHIEDEETAEIECRLRQPPHEEKGCNQVEHVGNHVRQPQSDLTGPEQERVNAIIAELEPHRRRLFSELTEGKKSEEEVSQELGELQQQRNEEIQDLLGDERARALFDALRRKDRVEIANDRSK